MPTMPQAAAGMRMEPPVSDPSAPNIMPAATATPDPAARAAAGPRRVPRVEAGSELGDRAGRVQGHLVAVQLGDDDRAGPLELADEGGVPFGDMAVVNVRAHRGRDAGHVGEVLDADGHAMQRPAVAAADDFAFGLPRGRQRLIAEDRGRGVERRAQPLGARQAGAGHLNRADLAGGDALADLDQAELPQLRGVSHPRPPSRARRPEAWSARACPAARWGTDSPGR